MLIKPSLFLSIKQKKSNSIKSSKISTESFMFYDEKTENLELSNDLSSNSRISELKIELRSFS